MGLEVAPYIADLTETWPLSTDKIRDGDDHLRLIKNAVKASFPNIDAPVTATPAQLNQPIASGLICAYSGLIADIPAGWILCNGANGTPNLQGVFIAGAGGGFVEGTTGSMPNSGSGLGYMILCWVMKG